MKSQVTTAPTNPKKLKTSLMSDWAHLTPMVGVGVIVIKNGTHILLHQRIASHGTGTWRSGGGHLEHSESLVGGALRELREEAGDKLVVGPLQFLGVCNFLDFMPKHYVDISFVAEYISGEPLNTEPEKKTDWQWFHINELPEPLFPVVRYYLDAFTSKTTLFRDAGTTL